MVAVLRSDAKSAQWGSKTLSPVFGPFGSVTLLLSVFFTGKNQRAGRVNRRRCFSKNRLSTGVSSSVTRR